MTKPNKTERENSGLIYGGLAASTSAGMRAWRLALLLPGIAVVGWAAVNLYDLLRREQLESLVIWLAGVLIVHDAVLVPATLAVGAVLWWLTRRLPAVSARILVGGCVVAGVLTLLAVPAIERENVRNNDTILFMDYSKNLTWLLVTVAVVSVVAAAVLGYASRVKARSRSGQNAEDSAS